MRQLRIAASVLLMFSLSACAVTMSQQPATMDNIQTIRAARIPNVAVGTFGPAPSLPAHADTAITFRADSLSAPSGSFSAYLRQTLITQLTASGRFDANSPIVISGLLTESNADTALDRPHAVLGAEFTVTRGGQQIFRKSLQVEDSWTGDFFGAVAIPDAMNHYTALYSKLVGVLMLDPGFRAAVASTP
jgi:hypothetical protein